MDDLIIPSATLESLQRKADIISVFCIIFGVDIAKQKLRSYMVNWSSVDITTNPTLIVLTGTGSHTQCSFEYQRDKQH